jgi:hypothetical protein
MRIARLGSKRCIRHLALAVTAVLAGGQASAVDVLIIPDQAGGGLDALVASLTSQGVSVTVSPATKETYDGASPAPAGFDSVIQFDAAILTRDMPDAGQQALVSYVAGGGRFIHAEWEAYDFSLGHLQLMRDIILFDSTQPTFSAANIVESPIPGQEGSPLLSGLPFPFTLIGSYDAVTVHAFATQPAQALTVDAFGNPGVAERSYGAGTVVGFHFAASGVDQHTLGNPTVDQLYLNAVLWQAQALPPSIALVGPSMMTIGWNTPFVDPGATASDPVDGNLTPAITVSGSVNPGALGTYLLSYSVSDRAGLSASTTRSVMVVDLTPPVITLNGKSPMAWPMNVAFVDPGATATDDHDGDVSASLVSSGSVDVSHAGSYIITYQAHDASGNVATRQREVDVYAPPVVTVSVATDQLPWTGGMSDVGLRWNAASLRPIVSVSCSVTQDEALTSGISPAHDAELTLTAAGFPDHLSLRCARTASADGRVYLIMITVQDDLGQSARAMCTVVVPKGGGKQHLAEVLAQAQADLQAGLALPVDSFGVPTANG